MSFRFVLQDQQSVFLPLQTTRKGYVNIRLALSQCNSLL